MGKQRYKSRRLILCPWCGNEIMANDSDDSQKCKWCRRLYKVKAPAWEPECQEFEGGFEFEKPKRPKYRFVDGHVEYENEGENYEYR